MKVRSTVRTALTAVAASAALVASAVVLAPPAAADTIDFVMVSGGPTLYPNQSATFRCFGRTFQKAIYADMYFTGANGSSKFGVNQVFLPQFIYDTYDFSNELKGSDLSPGTANARCSARLVDSGRPTNLHKDYPLTILAFPDPVVTCAVAPASPFVGDVVTPTATISNASVFNTTSTTVNPPVPFTAVTDGSVTCDGTGTITATAAGETDWSKTVTATVRYTVQPLPVVPRSTGVTYGAVSLDASGNAVQAYSITMPAAPTGWKYGTLTGSAACKVDTPVTPTLVRDGATNANVISGAAVTVTPSCDIAAPSLSTVSTSGDSVTATFDASAAPAGSQVVPEYRVQGSNSWTAAPAQALPASNAGSIAFTASGLTPPKTVEVRVKVKTGVVESGYSGTVTSSPESPSTADIKYPRVTGTVEASVTPTAPQSSKTLAAISSVGGTWSWVSGPKGLSVNAKTGEISGTPKDALGDSKTNTPGNAVVRASGTGWSVDVNVPMLIDPAPPQPGTFTYPLVTGQVGVPVAVVAPVKSGVKGFYYSPDLCAKIPGLDIKPRTGEIFGTPIAAAGSSARPETIEVRVRDTAPAGSSGCVPYAGTKGVASGDVRVVITPGVNFDYPSTKVTIPTGTPWSMTPSNPPPGSNYDFQVTGGVLPAGLTLDAATGVISGTPSAATPAAHVTITFTQANALGKRTSDVDFVVFDASNATQPTYPAVSSTVGVTKQVFPAPIPGWGTYALAAGAPAGMTIDPATGRIDWVATNPAGPRSIAVTAVNPGGQTVPLAAFTWTVTAAPTGAAGSGSGTGASTGANTGASTGPRSIGVCSAPAGSLYPPTVQGHAGSTLTFAPNLESLPLDSTFSVISGSLPAGVTLDAAAGVVSGTPETANGGSGLVQIAATAPDGRRQVSAVNFSVDDPHHGINYPNRVIASVGVGVTVVPTTFNQTGATRYELTCGTLPDGLSLDAKTGVISGVPTTLDERPVPLRVKATDAYGSVEASQIIVVNPGMTPWLRYPALTEFGKGLNASIVPTITGTAPVASWTVTGDLPVGITFDTTSGVFSGKGRIASKQVYEPTVTALAADGTVLATSWASMRVALPAVPMTVKHHRAGLPITKTSTVLVKSVKRPAGVTLSAKVKCVGKCSWTFNKKNGKLVVKKTTSTKQVSVLVLGTPKNDDEYSTHAWQLTWKVKKAK